jgi:hypothetical protein
MKCVSVRSLNSVAKPLLIAISFLPADQASEEWHGPIYAFRGCSPELGINNPALLSYP